MEGKKDGKQKYRVRINYVDPNGVARQTERVIAGLNEAKEFAKNLANSVKKPMSDKTSTMNALATEYMRVKKHEIRESSYEKSEVILRLHVLPHVGSKRLSALSLPVLLEWKQTINEKNLSPRMNQNIFSEFRALLNYAVKMDYISSNLLKRLGNFKNAYAESKSIDFYTADEFLEFLSVAHNMAQNSTELYEWN